MRANRALGATDLMPTCPVTLGFLTHLENHKAILYKVAYMYCRDREERQDLVQEMVIQL
jgi:DNA-directed RNA polymerase specialized sigma24 family protein